MEFRILGPVELRAAGERVDAGPPRQRGVLVALAVDAGRPVPADTVVDRVWGEPRNERLRHTLHVYVGRIRRTLDQAAALEHGDAVRVLHRSGGYLLDVDPDRVDAHRFRRLVDRARGARLPDDERVNLLRQALELWRGTPFADVPGEWAARVRESWQQQRVDALVAWGQLELRLGRADVVVGTVSEVISEHPLVESLVAVQMRALHAAGRGAEALDVFARTRQRLADQLGADPGAELRALHTAILRGDLDAATPAAKPALRGNAPAPSTAQATPAQLPLDVYGFTGRDAELGQLDAILAGAGAHPTAVIISALSGTAGVGKTALAVHWAHRVRDRFPDGQLYVNLRGFDPIGTPMSAAEAVRGFLDALDAPPHKIPAGLDAQIGLYRSLLVGRRMLVVLDNARDADQVRPLLPGTPGCLVLVTSRNQLPGLVAAEGAHPLTLDLLPADDAREMLTRRVGRARVAAEPSAVEAIINRCARLPLALAVVAARAATHPGFPLRALAAELRDARSDLTAFAGGDVATDVRSVFSWSYQTLSPGAAQLFRQLGLHPGPDLAAPAAASLAGLPVRQAEGVLAELARAHLVAEHAPRRFTFHDLLRAYATELALANDPDEERQSSVRRLLDHYLHSALNANRLLDPNRPELNEPAEPSAGVVVEGFAGADDAMAWFVAEHPTLLDAIRLADTAGLDAHTWQLAWAFSTFLDRQGHWHDQVAVHHLALDATRRLGDRAAQAVIHRGLAQSYSRRERYDEASVHCRHALDLYREVGDRTGQAMAYQNLSWVSWRQGHLREAVDHARRALPLFRAADNTVGQASVLNAIGWYHILLGDFEQALVSCRESLALYVKLGNPGGEAHTWDSLGYAYHHLGNHEEAVNCYQRAGELHRETGNRYGQAETLGHLGDTYRVMDDAVGARQAWGRALAIFEELGHADAEEIRSKLATL